MDTIRTWIHDCTKGGHQYCPEEAPTRLPARVLDLAEDRYYLREHTDAADRYACLSHYWGTAGPSLKLTNDNMSHLKLGGYISELPKTFRDAMEVCLQLDIQFLWIDALCECGSYVSGYATEF